MNDSFLEELELIPKESKKASQQLDYHVTTRHATSSPLVHFSERDERNNVRQQKEHFSPVPGMSDINIANSKEPSVRNSKKLSDQHAKKHSANVKIEKTDKILDSKARSVDAKIKVSSNNQHSVSRENKTKVWEVKFPKASESKDRKRRSDSNTEATHFTNSSLKENKRSLDFSNNNSSDTSSKENSRPSDSSKEAGSHNPTKEKSTDKPRKSVLKIREQDPVVLLTAIKELISTYTKQESTKILRAMQELHINSQATLIKNLLNQTDDLVKEMHPSKDSARVKALIEENEQMQQELMTLRLQNQHLLNKLDELEFLKQENATLKLKCNEVSQT
ncbi:hypothetical protein PUN28_009605 [Cardiocondyla obscurior]|uniref:Uncharacterized protein n=1 Tax=Cardiocondyla obscurior TaxID=286306 RepID=A0AAW2FT35_9HYME